jgi:Flp pilus assembly protein TadD
MEIDPNDADAHCNLGNTLARLGRLDEAVAHYQAALKIEPHNAQAYFNLGNASACRGQLAEAAACYRQALEIQPDNAGAHNGLGLVLAGQGRHDAAMTHYRMALKLQPGDTEIQKNLAWLRATCPEASLRNGVEAIEFARQANQSCGGKRLDILDVLAAAYAEAGWFAEALAAERKALELARQQNDRASADVMRARLALYEAGRPYHQTRSTAPPLPPKP